MLKMNTTNRYDKYKDSGIEWIGEIPESWNINKIGQIYQERNEKVSDKEFKPLSVTKNGIVPQLENAAKTDNGDNRKLVRQNDFVINSRSDRRGSCGISDYTGSVSLINTVLTPRKNMVNQYYNFTFKSECFADEFYRWGTGIVDDLWSTKWSSMKNIYIPYPNVKEQESIAGYLDRKCGAIDETIEKQRSVIEKLKEYKQSIITQAVTKGLDKSAPMKDSGIEWIGQIPQHWEIRKLKTIGDYRNGLTYSPEDICEENNGTLVLRSSNIKNGKISFNDNVYVSSNIPEILKVKKDDILICSRNGSKDLIGKNALIPEELNASFGAFTMIFRCKCPQYMYNILNSHIFSYYLGSFFTSTINQLTGKNFGNMDIVYCPNINEQNQINAYLDKKCSEIDKTIEDKEKLIEKLVEYKKSLIYECVTGKRKVVA